MDQTPGGQPPNIRAFQPDGDVPLLVDLLAAVEAADLSGEDVGEETVRAHLALPGHDPSLDRWVAVMSGKRDVLVGWSFVWLVPGETLATLDVAVHPRWRRQGIGSILLGRAVERAGALGAERVGIYANERSAAGKQFALAHGFHHISSNTLLRVESGAALPAPSFPAGYIVRPYSEIDDPSTLLTAFDRCYEGQWGHHAVSPEVLAEWLPTLRTQPLLILLGPAGEVVGMCRAEHLHEAIPYVDAPGIVPECRAVGLYVPLLLAACAQMRGARPRAIDLESWGDTDQTLALYEGLGFAVVRRALAYERPLAVPAP